MASPSPRALRGEGTGEVKSELHRKAVLPGELLQRNLRPRADMLNDFGGGERAELSRIFIAGIAHEPEQETGSKEVAGAGRVDNPFDGECRHRDHAVA